MLAARHLLSPFYIAANALYGSCMTLPLPHSDYRWLNEEEIADLDFFHRNMLEDGGTGIIVECDLHYPQELHEAHNEYPLAPHRFTGECLVVCMH